MKSTISYGYPYASAGIETALPVIENKSTPGQTLEFKAGGYHLMLMDLKQPVRVGFEVQLTLVFEGKDGKRESVYVHAPIANKSPHVSSTDNK